MKFWNKSSLVQKGFPTNPFAPQSELLEQLITPPLQTPLLHPFEQVWNQQ